MRFLYFIHVLYILINITFTLVCTFYPLFQPFFYDTNQKINEKGKRLQSSHIKANIIFAEFLTLILINREGYYVKPISYKNNK
jgi:hypothetical protein